MKISRQLMQLKALQRLREDRRRADYAMARIATKQSKGSLRRSEEEVARRAGIIEQDFASPILCLDRCQINAAQLELAQSTVSDAQRRLSDAVEAENGTRLGWRTEMIRSENLAEAIHKTSKIEQRKEEARRQLEQMSLRAALQNRKS